MKKFKSNRKGAELTSKELNNISGGRIVNIKEHPKVVADSMLQHLASIW